MQIGWRQKYATSRNLFTKTMASYSQKPSLKAYLEILLSLFTISILGIFAIRPTTITIGKLYNEIKAKEETIKRMDQKIQNLKNADELYNKEKSRLAMLKVAIPGNPEPDALIRQIEALSIETSVRTTALSTAPLYLLGEPPPDPSQEVLSTSGEKKVNLALILEGSFDNLSAFIKGLENLRRPISIGSLHLEKGQGGIEEVFLTLNLNNLSVPYLLEENLSASQENP
ncbi:hypothetical protein A3A76_04935 [Candidatus Woesebacteria bacterium RIFCSPLOWO2_01_FULL_39_23]|uniref:Uncharacterized protein n=2 Tax=Microgenomates group TaxID=1794810 RepID=A0A0H4T763_9BACT|nr:hypothetical protein [uncultured Microgenomates bacterium Rifle_16ft_4_minimus_37633]OGM13828.1 MAG: hypothetical protein A2141_04160 [Candidatus Woesebacteria bacterium RBG_16_40_11]OGM27778.1 MAG: hypothetical protein A2628_05155 [Candidatus Woesebacteria bacterium RIFCSPHIGHO2_01_FULL_40_22]OGM36208.1 MAG: hypothetical protein A3E41_00855 [Candidatus Woesebacteria bacterium RIFCSPHIGHO2_12_FULL_38_9]OGM62200.1 MAG: hypothetical protein A3A76_04935 [Candidatus Woesebacteria bacterium RIFCS